MGSYVTIVNDTNQPQFCQMAQVTNLRTWSSYGERVLQLLLAAGALQAKQQYVKNDRILLSVKLGKNIDPNLLSPAPGIVADRNGTTDIGIAISNSVAVFLKAKGFNLLMPGERLRSDKKTLSLMRQADCKVISMSGDRTYIHSTYMETIYTGPTAGSNHDYHIGSWERKRGVVTEIIDNYVET